MTDDAPKTFTQIGDKTVEAGTKLPESRTFRAAWVLEGDIVTVDMDAARALARDRIRAERAPFLADLDVQFQRAQEDGEDTAGIVADKKILRNAPADSRLDAAQDPASLEAAMNEIIKEMGEV